MLEEFLKYLQYEKNYSTHTVLSYKKDIEQFLTYFADTNKNVAIEQAEKDDIRLWVVDLMNKKFTSTSVNRKLSALKSFYKYLLKNNIIAKNQASGIVAPKKGSPIPVFFTEKEINKLDTKNTQKKEFETVRNDLIIELLYQTGIRRAELINIKINDIDFYRKTIKIFGKRKKERFIPFGENLDNEMKYYLKKKEEKVNLLNNYFFVLENGKPLYPRAVYNIVTQKLASISTKLKHSPHTLRHTFATALLNNGAELNAVKELLGHSSLASTQVYTHTSFKELQNIYKKTHPRAN